MFVFLTSGVGRERDCITKWLLLNHPSSCPTITAAGSQPLLLQKAALNSPGPTGTVLLSSWQQPAGCVPVDVEAGQISRGKNIVFPCGDGGMAVVLR